jgi:mannose-6-phosphate isomerase-like protein (cupin superfamily)
MEPIQSFHFNPKAKLPNGSPSFATEEPPMAAQTEDLWFINSRMTVLRAAAEGTPGVFLAEARMPHGDSPPLHVHHRDDEVFHILEGVVRFRVGDTEIVGRAGDTLVGPKGVPHTFRVESPEGARMLNFSPGADFEGLVRDIGRPAAHAGLPEPAEPTAEMQAALAAAAEARRISILGPPMTA